MSLPTFDPAPDQRQGRPRPLGGYEIMRKLKRNGLKRRVLVLTALENFGSRIEPVTFEDISRRCKHEFGEMFLGAVRYTQSGNMWRADVIALTGVSV